MWFSWFSESVNIWLLRLEKYLRGKKGSFAFPAYIIVHLKRGLPYTLVSLYRWKQDGYLKDVVASVHKK